MKTPDWVVGGAGMLLSLSVPIILIISPLYLFFTPAMVRHEYNRPEFPPSSRFDRQERLWLSDAIICYVRGGGSVEALERLRTDQGERALRDVEVKHLVDVRRVLDGLFLAHGAALVVGLMATGMLVWWTLPIFLTRALKRGVWFTVGLMALVLLSSLVDFDVFFTRFHQIFFSPGTWVFYARDTLIQLYPLAFWVDVVWKLSVFILVEASTLYAMSALVAGHVSRGTG